MPHNDLRTPPTLMQRLLAVWFRHFRVYTKNLISNGLPPFLEPLVYLVGIGLGLGAYIRTMNGVPYINYLASGLLVSTAMFTATFECSFGTFIRLEFDKVYDGMLTAPITVNNLLVGEIFWAGSKGFFFTFAVMVIIAVTGVFPIGRIYPVPLIGFLTGVMFATLALFITSFVKNINHFNFLFSGFISPMFFFSGVFFPLDRLPAWVRPIAEALPLTHTVRLSRAICFAQPDKFLLFDLAYSLLFSAVFGFFAVRRLKHRLVD
ncbi:ABC transporter permease [Salinispira pacifica]